MFSSWNEVLRRRLQRVEAAFTQRHTFSRAVVIALVSGILVGLTMTLLTFYPL